MIHITNGQSDNLLDFITKKNIYTDTHRESLQDNLETFEFETFANKSFSKHITKRNRLVIPAEDEGFKEFIIHEAIKYHDSEGLRLEVYGTASYLELKKAEIIEPQSFKEETPATAVSRATNETEWRPGIIEGTGFRTFVFEEYTNPFAFLKTIANEFNLELRFRIEISGNRITGRFVDLLNRIGNWKGREVSFDKDLIGIKRTEKTDNVFTALLGLGVEREDGSRLKVLVEDQNALQRWGRKDPITGELKHLIETYQPESSRLEMTESELRQYTRTELNKRINAVVEYEADIADLENVPGMENKKIRFGDTIKIKDTKFEPPLYLEARVHTQERSITDPSKKTVTLGDYIEYTEEQVMSAFKEMREEINRRFARLLVTNVLTSAGNTFKNGEGETELTAKVFLSGAETDTEGDYYTYAWKKFDKRGIPVSSWSITGKTIEITANEIDEKATYQVEIIADSLLSIGQITLSNIFDGKDGPPGKDGEQGVPGEQGPQGPNVVNKDTDFDNGYDPTTKETPEGAQEKANQAEENAKGHADAVSEAAYLDALQDAEEYMSANGVMQGRNYNGVSITNQDGFVTARGDGLVRTVMNSTLGYVVQRRSSTSSSWQDVIYFDTNGNAKYAGDLVGATGTFGEVTVKNGDFTLEDDVTDMKYSATPKRNLIRDHSFELVKTDPDSFNSNSARYNWIEMRSSNIPRENHWIKAAGSPKVCVMFVPNSVDAIPVFGEQAISVRQTDYVYQNVWDGIGASGHYTLSGHFKRQWNVVGGGSPRFEVWHVDGAGNKVSKILDATFPAVGNDYSIKRHAASFVVPSNYSQVDSLEVKISSGNSEWVQCDGIQMVEGSIPSVYQTEDATFLMADGGYEISFNQNMLWAGAIYPQSSHTVVPDKPLQDCRNGWILEWKAYTPGQGAENSNFQYYYIPKRNTSGYGHRLNLARGSNMIEKYIYIYNDRIVGNDVNSSSPNNTLVLSTVFEF